MKTSPVDSVQLNLRSVFGEEGGWGGGLKGRDSVGIWKKRVSEKNGAMSKKGRGEVRDVEVMEGSGNT